MGNAVFYWFCHNILLISLPCNIKLGNNAVMAFQQERKNEY